MSDLPPGWEWATLGDLASSVKNGIYVSRPGREPVGVPILRISAVRPMRLDSQDVRYSNLSFAKLEGQDALLNPGDLLFTRYSGNPDYVGACARVPTGAGSITYPDKLIRVRLPGVDSQYVAAAFASPQVRKSVNAVLRTTAGQVGISGSALKAVRLPLPPIAEQKRIVAALEGHLSRIDGGVGAIAVAKARLNALRKRTVIEAVDGQARHGWDEVSIAEAGVVDLGRQRHPDWHEGANMRPYLRVANVFEDEIRLGDLKEMDFPPDIFAKFALRSGDILLNEGQSPEYLGRPAMYRGEPGRFAFTNSLLRFRAGPEVLPEWALLVFRRHLHAGRFVKEVRITTNIAHLSAARFKSIEFPVPPIEVQAEIVKRTQETLDMITRMVSGVHAAARRGERLRQAVLADAFAGRLVPQDPTDEPASVLLERIRTERAAASKPTRTRRGPRPDPAQEALS